MRVLAVIFGGVFGIVIGVAIALLAVIVLTHNEPFGVILLGILIAPLGLIFGGTIGVLASLQLLPHLRDRGSGQVRTKKALLAGGVLISGTLILIALLVWTLRIGTTPPSDQKLLLNFDKHEATFNKLIEMIKTDSDLIRVDEDWTDPKDPKTIGVSRARIISYRQMLREARVPRGFRSESFVYDVDFFYWMIGSAVSSDITKGYAYRASAPIETLGSLDGYQPDPKNSDDPIKVYRHIRGNWYLFYEYIPG